LLNLNIFKLTDKYVFDLNINNFIFLPKGYGTIFRFIPFL
jgi:hypothetical protein